MTIVELMVAVLIGLLSMYAVYRVYEGTERTKRTIASVGDTQIAGLYSIFLLEQDIHNAGSGLMRNTTELANGCPGGIAMGGVASPATLSFRSLPVYISPSTVTVPGFLAARFDEVFTFSGGSSRHIRPVGITAVTPPDTATVASPFGFKDGDAVIEMATTGCSIYRVNGNSVVNATNGTATAVLVGNGAPTLGATLVDLGVPVRHHFYVDQNNTLQMAEWTLPNPGQLGAGQWRLNRTDPIVSNVVFFQAQYGRDTTPTATGAINTWTGSRDTNPWLASLMNATTPAAAIADIRQIKAVRLAIIVRSDEPESPATFNQATSFTPFQDCPAGMTCLPAAAAINFPAGTGPGGTTYRYRMYETIVPLKNAVWNPNS